MEIRRDDLSQQVVQDLVTMHWSAMQALSPPESMHAFGIDELQGPHVAFYTAWAGEELLGCGALKMLDGQHAEIKSMRTVPQYLRRGVASGMLAYLVDEAERRGCFRIYLETGSGEDFQPARALYAKYGFEYCGPFFSYREDPESVFMTKRLGGGH